MTAVNSDDTSGNKGCTIAVLGPDGKTQSTITYALGYSFKAVNKATGKTHTHTCNNGTWVEIVESTSPVGGYLYEVDDPFVDGSAALTLVNPHEQYTYSPAGGFYAGP